MAIKSKPKGKSVFKPKSPKDQVTMDEGIAPITADYPEIGESVAEPEEAPDAVRADFSPSTAAIIRISGIPPMEYRIVSKTKLALGKWQPLVEGDSMFTWDAEMVEYAMAHPDDFTVYSPSGAELQRL